MLPPYGQELRLRGMKTSIWLATMVRNVGLWLIAVGVLWLVFRAVGAGAWCVGPGGVAYECGWVPRDYRLVPNPQVRVTPFGAVPVIPQGWPGAGRPVFQTPYGPAVGGRPYWMGSGEAPDVDDRD